ncbi:MAG: hypothetical protein M3Q05_13285 [Bacteroidota bacterium]|nr:hypothetical protein [Bacteroidota bacterium]
MITFVSNVSLVKKSFIEIEYDPQNEWLYVNWIGSFDEERGMTGCEDVLLALQKYQVNKIINDNRNVVGSWDEAVSWLVNSWFPRFLGVGCFYIAWVQSPCLESQASMAQTLQFEIPNVTILVFNDVETAKNWLNEM